MTLGEFREQTKELSDDLVLELYSERYNDSTQPIRLEFDTEGYIEFIIDDDRWCLGQEKPIFDKIRTEIENHCGLVKENHCKYCSYCNSVMGVREILEIIDKYKVESEDKKMTEHEAILQLKDITQIFQAEDRGDIDQWFYNQFTLDKIREDLQDFNCLIGEIKQILKEVENDN